MAARPGLRRPPSLFRAHRPGMPDWREAVRSIEALGFSLSGRFPVSRTERLEQRVRVLEQLATDRGVDTAAQIEALRDFKRIEDKAPAR